MVIGPYSQVFTREYFSLKLQLLCCREWRKRNKSQESNLAVRGWRSASFFLTSFCLSSQYHSPVTAYVFFTYLDFLGFLSQLQQECNFCFVLLCFFIFYFFIKVWFFRFYWVTRNFTPKSHNNNSNINQMTFYLLVQQSQILILWNLTCKSFFTQYCYRL